MMGLIIVGAILIAIGVGMILYKKKIEDKITNVKYHDSTDLKSVLDACLGISKDLGTGHFSQIVKTSATAVLDRPFKGEFSKMDCVYCETEVIHMYDEMEETKDDNGRTQRKWVSRTESLGRNKVGEEFWLNDATARVTVNINGANLGLKNEVYREVKTQRPVQFSFATYNPVQNDKRKSTGYIEVERHLKPGAKLFVVGELHDRDGQPKITKPQDKKETFVVSTKSEEDVVKGLESKAKMMYYGGFVVAILGVLAVIASFFK
jgi:hypothetical protein